MECHWLKDQRGSVLLFTIALMVFLLVMGGIAIDLTYLGAARGELQRSMDAAALAGAGNLSFDDTVFPTVRQEAWRFGNLNPYRVGTVNLDTNAANDPSGDIVLGIWDGAGFTPSDDGTRVNAVLCRYDTTIATSFLRLLGFTALPVSAEAIGVANPPLTPEEEACIFPIGLADCAFQDAGVFSSQGCGATATLISSSSQGPGLFPGASNTAAWVSLDGTGATPNANSTRDAIRAAANGSCQVPADGGLEVGDPAGTNNGMQQSVFNVLEEEFIAKFNSAVQNGENYEVTDTNNVTTYNGPGWEVMVPVITTGACPPQAINGQQTITGWTRMVMTQVINHGTCAVTNPNDTNSAGLCPDSGDPNLRAVFGYYDCTLVDSPTVVDPAPRSALATRLRLVR